MMSLVPPGGSGMTSDRPVRIGCARAETGMAPSASSAAQIAMRLVRFDIAICLSFTLEADGCDELRPSHLLAVDIGRVLLRRARHRFAAFDREPSPHLVGGEHGVELLVESLDDRTRRAGGREQGRPLPHLEAGQARFGDGRDIGPEARAFGLVTPSARSASAETLPCAAGIGANIMAI